MSVRSSSIAGTDADAVERAGSHGLMTRHWVTGMRGSMPRNEPSGTTRETSMRTRFAAEPAVARDEGGLAFEGYRIGDQTAAR